MISPDGHILTATSTVPAGAEKIKVMFPGFVTREATLVAADDALAVSLIKVDVRDLPCLPFTRDLPEVGSTAYTAGDVENAMRTNGRASFSRGIVSGIYTVPKNPEALYTGVAIMPTPEFGARLQVISCGGGTSCPCSVSGSMGAAARPRKLPTRSKAGPPELP